jgi:hypothetical protein
VIRPDRSLFFARTTCLALVLVLGAGGFAYGAGDGPRLGGWYITQGVQTLDRSIPLVAGRAGLLRVFVLAQDPAAAAPEVRVTVTGGAEPWVQTIHPPRAGMPGGIAEGDLEASWNLVLPATALRPGASLKLELQPGSDTVAVPLEVRTVPVFRGTIIPVVQQGLTANVTDNGRTLDNWADRLHAMYPLADPPAGIDLQLGATYTTQADLNDASGIGWDTLVAELDRKQVAEGAGRNYFGAVSVNYTSGMAGLGQVGGQIAIGWDKTGLEDGANYQDVFAHEMGHNFNREHAPCGVGGGDPAWPGDGAHSSASIGVYGFDLGSGAAKSPADFKDIMSYCHPYWSSDYTYRGVLDWRGRAALAGSQVPALAATECLLVSGRIRDGKPELDPAFTVRTRPRLPEPGPFTLELQAGSGTPLRLPFTPSKVADGPRGDSFQFTFAIPLERGLQANLRSVWVTGPDGQAVFRAAPPSAAFPPPVATALGSGMVRVRWDETAWTGALVRHGRTGEVLAFARGGQAEVATDADSLEVTLSDGVRSRRFVIGC